MYVIAFICVPDIETDGHILKQVSTIIEEDLEEYVRYYINYVFCVNASSEHDMYSIFRSSHEALNVIFKLLYCCCHYQHHHLQHYHHFRTVSIHTTSTATTINTLFIAAKAANYTLELRNQWR